MWLSTGSASSQRRICAIHHGVTENPDTESIEVNGKTYPYNVVRNPGSEVTRSSSIVSNLSISDTVFHSMYDSHF